jgi:hypothetical protein
MGVLHVHLAAILGLISVGTATPLSTTSGPDPPPESEPGTQPVTRLELRPEVSDFEEVPIGEDDDRTVRIVNLGTKTVTLGEVTVDGPGFAVLFDNCSGEAVERDDSCAVTIMFLPPEEGSFVGHVRLHEPVELVGDLVGRGVSGPSSSLPATSVVEPPPPPPPPTTAPPATSGGVPTTSAGAPTTTNPDGNDGLAEQLRQCEADAAEAEIGFTPELHMVVDEVTNVRVTAVAGEGPVITAGPGPTVTVVAARLHCEVEATLRGQDFDIDPSEPQPGSFLDQPTIVWTWQVTPTSSGPHTLQFRILPVAREDEIRLPGTPVLFEATISVDAAPKSFWERVDDVVRGIAGHPVVTGFGALAAMAAVLAAGWRWILRRPWPWADTAARRVKGPPPPPGSVT